MSRLLKAEPLSQVCAGFKKHSTEIQTPPKEGNPSLYLTYPPRLLKVNVVSINIIAIR